MVASRAWRGRSWVSIAALALVVSTLGCRRTRSSTEAPQTASKGKRARTSSAASESAARACGPAPTLQRFEVPRFALDQGAFAAELSSGVVLMSMEPAQGRPRTHEPQPGPFHGAMLQWQTQSWTELPPPPDAVLAAAVVGDAYFAAAGEHVAMLAWTSMPARFGGVASTATAVFDVAAHRWVEVPQADAPPAVAYNTGPYRAQSTDRFWVWWPSHEQGTNYAGGYMLDMAAGAWRRTNPTGAPAMHSYSRPRLLPDQRLLVIPVKSDAGGIFDPAANRWQPFQIPASEHGYENVALSEDGRWAAVLHFVELPDRQRRIDAYVVDLSSLDVDVLPSADVLVDNSPNTKMLHVDGARLVYINEMTLHVLDRRKREWSTAALPFEDPVRGSDVLITLCGNRLLVEGRPWLLHVDELAWHELAWPNDVPQRARHRLYASDHVVLLGDLWKETQPHHCPPGAPCLPPETHTVEVTASYLVPLLSGPAHP